MQIREQVKIIEHMKYVLSEQAKTHQGAIALVQMLCVSDMLRADSSDQFLRCC